MAALPSKTRVSVAIICFNYGRFLGECLDSCLAQTVSADEIIVVDDGSTDDSADVLDGYDPAFRPFGRSIRGGICAAANAALAAYSGDVVVLLDKQPWRPDASRWCWPHSAGPWMGITPAGSTI